MPSNEDATSIICEQGDMGLWNNELSPEDQKKLKEQKDNESSEKKIK